MDVASFLFLDTGLCEYVKRCALLLAQDLVIYDERFGHAPNTEGQGLRVVVSDGEKKKRCRMRPPGFEMIPAYTA